MDAETEKIAGFIFSYVVGIVVLGLIAAAKNRNYMAWALIGGLFSCPCLIALLFLPTLCPKCRRPLLATEWRRRECPTCGPLDKPGEPPKKATVLMEKATKLEIQGQVQQAMEMYQDFIDAYPGTEAAHDAQKSLDSLRVRLE
jgi:hypothetical protein